MKTTFLEFEQPIAELETKIEELRYVQTESAVDISEEIDQLGKKSQQLTKDIYSQLTPWQITKIARHPERPYTLDYIREIFTDFVEMHGDRHFADDLSIVGGLARFNGNACMVLGHQKGRDTKERALRNFGMTKPEGYRKALRLMKTAEKFKLPVFTFVDTPGAFPGIDAEERGQSEAIGRNIFARDNNQCQYCGKKFPTSELSLDHVIPRSQGGGTTWDNIVCSCVDCNVRKGGRTPRQANMTLIRKPEKPKRSPLLNLKLTQKKYQSWQSFIDNAYWTVDLK